MTTDLHRRSPVDAGETGSTLLEALVGVSILAISLVYLFGAMSSLTMINGRSQARTNAAAAARSHVEQLRFTDPTTFPDSGSTSSAVSVGQHQFTILTQFCSNTSYCDDNTRHVVVTVQEDGQNVFETETVFTQMR